VKCLKRLAIWRPRKFRSGVAHFVAEGVSNVLAATLFSLDSRTSA
jgi:hypothetical protein